MSKSLIERLRADAVLFDVNPEDDVQGLNATALLEREAADELERMVRMTDFIYLLNAMENAAAQENPSKHDYSGKRQAVLNYVDALAPRSDMVSVPREPTQAMMEAGYREVGAMHYSPTAEQGWGTHAINIYKAMLAAAEAGKEGYGNGK